MFVVPLKEWKTQSGRHGMLNELAANNSWSSGSPDDPTYSSVAPMPVYIPANQQQQQQQQPPVLQPAASAADTMQSTHHRTGDLPVPPVTSTSTAARVDVDPSALYATVNKPAQQPPAQQVIDRPQSASPLSTDSSATTTSSSSSDADAAMAGLTIAMRSNVDDGRENPFNTLSSMPAVAESPTPTSPGGWQPSALPEQFQPNVSPFQPALPGRVTVESPADVSTLEPSSQVTEQAMSLTSLSALHSGLVAPSTTPAVAGLLDTTAADAAMAVAMAAAATLHEAVSVDEHDEEALLEKSPSQSSMLSDLSDS